MLAVLQYVVDDTIVAEHDQDVDAHAAGYPEWISVEYHRRRLEQNWARQSVVNVTSHFSSRDTCGSHMTNRHGNIANFSTNCKLNEQSAHWKQTESENGMSVVRYV